jgi:hypothetical protein
VSDALIRREVLAKLEGVRPSGGGYMARCPMPKHNDSQASVAINPGQIQPVVMKCHGCGATAQEISEAAGIDWALLSTSRPRGSSARDEYIACGWDRELQRHDWRHRKVAEYVYRDPQGKVVFGVARCALKGNGCQGFRQWRPDPSKRSGRSWSRTLPDGTKAGEGLIYRLPEIIAPDQIPYVFVVEGEKDADRLWNLNLPATTNPQGGTVGKWTAEHAKWLATTWSGSTPPSRDSTTWPVLREQRLQNSRAWAG